MSGVANQSNSRLHHTVQEGKSQHSALVIRLMLTTLVQALHNVDVNIMDSLEHSTTANTSESLRHRAEACILYASDRKNLSKDEGKGIVLLKNCYARSSEEKVPDKPRY